MQPAPLLTGELALLRLLQLTSPALPVGAFAYSQGLEWAVNAGWVIDEESAGAWIGGLLEHAIAHLEIPLLARLHAAWCAGDGEAVVFWNAWLGAARESAELLAEDRHMGTALARLLTDLGLEEARPWVTSGEGTFATLFALAAWRWEIPLRSAAIGLVWAWAENQVAAATKLVPLGQTAAQRLLSGLQPLIPAAVDRGLTLEEPDIGQGAPALAAGCALHETQYSRLFRS